MKTIIVLALLILLAQSYYDNLCRSYLWDKGAILTLQGVFCERTVQSSWDVPYLPLEGAQRQFEYRKVPDPRWQIPAPSAGDV